MAYDYYLQSLKEQIAKLRYGSQRVTEPVEEAAVDARASVRQLSRVRVAALLRELRAVHGFTYAQIQNETGLSQQLLFDMEFKDRRLTLDELRLLTDLYGVSVGDVLGIEME
ncbi:MAG: helix-turn-helix transcriptional regulator [Caldilineaceae bacterium]|nr:helix-turn-helix transcriptional regulator [Caldilineaceae bacterium]